MNSSAGLGSGGLPPLGGERVAHVVRLGLDDQREAAAQLGEEVRREREIAVGPAEAVFRQMAAAVAKQRRIVIEHADAAGMRQDDLRDRHAERTMIAAAAPEQ